MKDAKSQGYNQFIIKDQFSVSMRGINNNKPRKQTTLVLPVREFLYWRNSKKELNI